MKVELKPFKWTRTSGSDYGPHWHTSWLGNVKYVINTRVKSYELSYCNQYGCWLVLCKLRRLADCKQVAFDHWTGPNGEIGQFLVRRDL